MSSEVKKLDYISNAKIIGILLVVFGHSFPFNVEIPKLLNQLKIFIYCFHMPLFVFLSAFLVTRINSIERHGCKRYILGRAKKLFIPYIFMSLIGVLPKILLQNFINDNVEISFSYFAKAFLIPRDNIWGHFWFIPMIFILAVITIPYIFLLKKSKIVSVFICLVSFGLVFVPDITGWFGLNDVKNYLCWYLLGLLCGEIDVFENLKRYVCIYVCPIAAVICFLIKFYGYKSMVAFCMIFFIISISYKTNVQKINFFAKLNKCNFSIYILSWPVQAVVEVVANKVLGLPSIICMLLMLVSGILIPILITSLLDWINKRIDIKFLNYIVGY